MMDNNNEEEEEEEEEEDHLAFVRPDIDLGKVKPLPLEHLVWRVNQFICHTSGILNSFATRFETRLLELERRLDSFEREVVLLEKKLELVPLPNEPTTSKVGRGGVAAAETLPTIPTPSIPKKEEEGDATESSSNLQKRGTTDAIGDGRPPDDGMVPAREHLDFFKYFKMLRMGVPAMAVKQKMAAEGMDPSVIDAPDALLPKSITPTGQQQQPTGSAFAAASGPTIGAGEEGYSTTTLEVGSGGGGDGDDEESSAESISD